VLGIVAAATAAWAAFGTTVTAEASGSAEAVEEIIVEGQQLTPKLLPGEASQVRLVIANPNDNVKTAITGISPGTVTVAGLDDAAHAEMCASHIVTTEWSMPPLPTLGKEGSANVTITNGVKLRGEAPIECEGMTWKTHWNVQFQAVR
jgi:hypothetical protein